MKGGLKQSFYSELPLFSDAEFPFFYAPGISFSRAFLVTHGVLCSIFWEETQTFYPQNRREMALWGRLPSILLLVSMWKCVHCTRNDSPSPLSQQANQRAFTHK